MNGQERLQAIHGKRPHDRASFITLVDDITRRGMSKEFREMSPIDFYKHFGFDIYQFGNYGLAPDQRVKYPYIRRQKNVQIKWIDKGNSCLEQVIETPYGILRKEIRSGHPVKYPVETFEDLQVLAKIWRDTEYVLDLDGCQETFDRVKQLLEGSGIFVPTMDLPSAVQMLLEQDIGPENFYYMLMDYPKEMNELIALIHDRRCQEYRLAAKYMPFDACISVENTSTSYISPKIYREFSQRHMKDFVDIMHGEGKLAIIHMCGLINDLLEDFRPIGMDGIHALTEPPVGDTMVEHALNVLGEDLIVITLLDGTTIYDPDYTKEKMIAHLDHFVTDRLQKANVIFALGTDGLETPLDRFETVSEWFSKND